VLLRMIPSPRIAWSRGATTSKSRFRSFFFSRKKWFRWCPNCFVLRCGEETIGG
jgi:hypothetical protein